MKKTPIELPELDTDINNGLTDDQVQERVNASLANVSTDKVSKSYGRIIFDNCFTLFNIVLFSIAGVYLFFVIFLFNNGYQDVANQYFGVTKFTFLGPVVVNIIIGSFQEIKAKKTLENLRLVHESQVKVIRNGKEIKIKMHEVVRDDIIVLNAGDQIPCDIMVKEGYVQVDESLLTGESTLIKKEVGSTLLSGSNLIVGYCKGKAVKTGDQTYASSLSNKVKSLSRHKSQLMKDIYTLIRYLTVALFVIVVIVMSTLIYKVNVWGNDPTVFDGMTMSLDSPATWARILLTTGAFAISMIPTGLVLLTSITLAVSIVKLASQKTMIQELYSLENLSRVDTICLDKTGTLTDGTMKVVKTISYSDEEQIKNYFRDLSGAIKSKNATSTAIEDYFGKNENPSFKEIIPFSSETKYSGLVYENGDKLLLGAFEYLLDKSDERIPIAEKEAQEGNRVLAITLNGQLQAFLILEDNLRSSAKDTIEYFYENNVDVRIISGDNPITVSHIAKAAGVRNTDKYVSLEGKSLEEIPALIKDNIIFARVSPEQKQALVDALQQLGHKVAMTGDGVNDILALRKSNASITFAKATDAAKSCSDVVLLDNDFSHLKEVVFEGRRVVNNMKRTSTLFLMKSISILLIAILLIPMKKGQMWFSIENIYILEMACIGVGGFMLSMEGTKQPIQGDFMKNVLVKSVLSSLLVFLGVFIGVLLYAIPIICGQDPIIDEMNLHSMISMMTAFAGLIVCYTLCKPFNKFRWLCFGVIVFFAWFIAMFAPSALIGGQNLSFAMFSSENGFWSSQFIHEFFQPWNSESVHHYFSNIPCLINVIVYLLIGIIGYPLLYKFVDKKINHVR